MASVVPDMRGVISMLSSFTLDGQPLPL